MEPQARDVVSPESVACGAAAGCLVGSPDLADRRRIVVTVLLALGVPFHWYCVFAHTCMAGHMAHPPYSMWDHAVDVFWQGCYVAAGVFIWRSRFKYRLSIFLCLVLSLILTDWRPLGLVPQIVMFVLILQDFFRKQDADAT